MSTDQNFQVLGSGDVTLDAFGQQVVSNRLSLFSGEFAFDVPISLFRAEIDGAEEDLTTSTQITSVNGALNMVSSGTNGEVVLLESRRNPNFQQNRSQSYSGLHRIPVPNSLAVQDFGIFTYTNGVFFRCGVDGNLYACVVSGGVLTYEQLITLPCSFRDSYDITKINHYDIQINGDYFFYIENTYTHRTELVHVIRLLGQVAVMPIEDRSLPAAYRVTSLGAADGIWSGGVDISSSGGARERAQYAESSTQRTVTAGATSGGVVALLNPTLTPGGKLNTRDVVLARIVITADKKSTFKAYRTRDPSAITGGAFVQEAPGDFVQVNETFTALDYTKLTAFSVFKPEAGATISKQNPDPLFIDFYVIHGDYIVIACTDGVIVLCDASVEWGEEI